MQVDHNSVMADFWALVFAACTCKFSVVIVNLGKHELGKRFGKRSGRCFARELAKHPLPGLRKKELSMKFTDQYRQASRALARFRTAPKVWPLSGC